MLGSVDLTDHTGGPGGRHEGSAYGALRFDSHFFSFSTCQLLPKIPILCPMLSLHAAPIFLCGGQRATGVPTAIAKYQVTIESSAITPVVDSEVLQMIGGNREDYRHDRSTVVLCARPR